MLAFSRTAHRASNRLNARQCGRLAALNEPCIVHSGLFAHARFGGSFLPLSQRDFVWRSARPAVLMSTGPFGFKTTEYKQCLARHSAQPVCRNEKTIRTTHTE